MTATSHARRDDSDGIITVTLTCDEKRNAISGEMFDVLESAVLDLADDDRHRVLVLTAEGRYFTAGLDIAELVARSARALTAWSGIERPREYRRNARHDLFDEMEQIEKPIVLAAQGPSSALASSSACRATSASLRTRAPSPFRRLPTGGAAWVGWHQPSDAARRPALGAVARDGRPGRRCGGGPHHRARACGLSRVGVRRTGAGLRPAPAGLPREAVGLAKVAIDAAASIDRRTAREFDRLAQSTLLSSPDVAERIVAFLSKKQG